MNDITPTLGLSAYLLGRRIAGQRKRTPVAYLYNGVMLPALPEWDREKYPYAVIDFFVMAYRLHLFEHRPYALNGSSVTYGPMDGSTYIYKGANTEGNGKKWEFHAEYTDTDGIYASSIQWTNFDLQYEDGSLYLAASEPVPIYE